MSAKVIQVDFVSRTPIKPPEVFCSACLHNKKSHTRKGCKACRFEGVRVMTVCGCKAFEP